MVFNRTIIQTNATLILLLDNFDSFTYNLQDYFAQANVSCKIVRNNHDPSDIFKGSYKGIVLSPGPGRPQASGCMTEVIQHYEQTQPILGICLGHQAIGEYFGAKLVQADAPMHGKVSAISVSDDLMFADMPSHLNVVRYHSLILKDLPLCLEATAYTDRGEIMAIRHKTKPILGLQFHPEAILTDNGLQMLHNWVRFYHIAD